MKTIETTLTWYDPKIKIAPEMKFILIVTKKCGLFFKARRVNNEDFVCDYFPMGFHIDEIKYWAYLPDLEIPNE